MEAAHSIQIRRPSPLKSLRRSRAQASATAAEKLPSSSRLAVSLTSSARWRGSQSTPSIACRVRMRPSSFALSGRSVARMVSKARWSALLRVPPVLSEASTCQRISMVRRWAVMIGLGLGLGLGLHGVVPALHAPSKPLLQQPSSPQREQLG